MMEEAMTRDALAAIISELWLTAQAIPASWDSSIHEPSVQIL